MSESSPSWTLSAPVCYLLERSSYLGAGTSGLCPARHAAHYCVAAGPWVPHIHTPAVQTHHAQTRHVHTQAQKAVSATGRWHKHAAQLNPSLLCTITLFARRTSTAVPHTHACTTAAAAGRNLDKIECQPVAQCCGRLLTLRGHLDCAGHTQTKPTPT